MSCLSFRQDARTQVRAGEEMNGCTSTCGYPHAIAGVAAEARSGAILRGHAAVRLRLHSLHRGSFLHRLEDVAALHLRRIRELPEAVGARTLVYRARQHRDICFAVYRDLHGGGSAAGDLSRPED